MPDQISKAKRIKDESTSRYLDTARYDPEEVQKIKDQSPNGLFVELNVFDKEKNEETTALVSVDENGKLMLGEDDAIALNLGLVKVGGSAFFSEKFINKQIKILNPTKVFSIDDLDQINLQFNYDEAQLRQLKEKGANEVRSIIVNVPDRQGKLTAAIIGVKNGTQMNDAYDSIILPDSILDTLPKRDYQISEISFPNLTLIGRDGFGKLAPNTGAKIYSSTKLWVIFEDASVMKVLVGIREDGQLMINNGDSYGLPCPPFCGGTRA